MNKKKDFRGWEYKSKGDYHINLDPNWSYTPTYSRKMNLVREKIKELGVSHTILDAGCGEGELVREFRLKGYRIEGLDLNYESDIVKLGNLLKLPYKDQSFDAVLLLDVFEHLQFQDQPVALKEIYRVLKPKGSLIASIPNLAHFNSRFLLSFFGKLDRSDHEINHPGERPFEENYRLITDAGFNIVKIKGITLTVPILYRRIICRKPSWFRWLHDLLDLAAVPSFSMIDLFYCIKAL